MRKSEGSFAYIIRAGANPGGEVEYLLQWNPGWAAFNFIGGRVEHPESFRDCCVREVMEELELQEHVDYDVAPQPLAHLEYSSYSDSAKQDTAYIFELYETQLSEPAYAKVTADAQNLWVGGREIQAGLTRDGRKVSRTVAQILTRAGLLPANEATAGSAV